MDPAANAKALHSQLTLPYRSRLLFAGLTFASMLLLTYAALELLVSLGRALTITRRQDFVLIEASAEPVRFCPIFGYRLGQRGSRYCRVINGEVEVLATLRGNQLGLPDEDFTPSASGPPRSRILVLGDSFTAATFLDVNWPRRVEELHQSQAVDQCALELLNFSQEGIGLANWWSMLSCHIDRHNYEITGVVFAIFDGDLRRPFVFQDHTEGNCILGHSSGFDPATWPETVDEARSAAWALGREISAEQFAQTLAGQPPSGNLFRFEITFGIWKLSRSWSQPRLWLEDGRFDPGRQRLVDDVQAILMRRQWPVLVVTIPTRDDLLQSKASEPGQSEAVAFARQLGAHLLDGRAAFEGLTSDEIHDCFFPHDGHWCQRGSDRFASYVLPMLQQWLASMPAASIPVAHQPAAAVPQ